MESSFLVAILLLLIDEGQMPCQIMLAENEASFFLLFALETCAKHSISMFHHACPINIKDVTAAEIQP